MQVRVDTVGVAGQDEEDRNRRDLGVERALRAAGPSAVVAGDDDGVLAGGDRKLSLEGAMDGAIAAAIFAWLCNRLASPRKSASASQQ